MFRSTLFSRLALLVALACPAAAMAQPASRIPRQNPTQTQTQPSSPDRDKDPEKDKKTEKDKDDARNVAKRPLREPARLSPPGRDKPPAVPVPPLRGKPGALPQPPSATGPKGVDRPAGRPSANPTQNLNPLVPPRQDFTGVGTSAPVGPSNDLAGNQVLANTFRGNDGSAWYLRKEQSKVYMFGEHPGKKYATVFEGTLNGQLIAGQYWDCPKGTRTLRGQLQLQITSNGDTLKVQTQTGGLDLVELNAYAIDNNQLPRADRSPGFSSTSISDLDGAWRSGGIHWYLREFDDRIVGWMEQTFQTGQKPELARVAFGTRQDDGKVSFQLISLPKGQGTASANEKYVLDDAFHMRRLGGWTFVRDSLDIERMGEEIDKRFKDRCVGFGYAIAKDGTVVKTGGGGLRFLPMDGFDMAFDGDTQKDTQSTAKTITAVAVLHLLKAKGMDVDDRIMEWLPKTWKKGPGTESLTFKHLLTHRSGLVGYGDPDEYGNLKQTIETGPVNMNWIVPAFDYQNCNFALFRILIPYLEKRSDMHNFEDNGLSGATINERCSERYIRYVRDHILLPAGLENPQPTYNSSNIAYSYNFKNQNVAGYPQQANQRYECGAGGWVVSARDYVKFLAALENGKLLPASQLAQMKSEQLGVFATGTSVGNAYLHGGSIGGTNSDSYGSGRGARAFAIMFANNVQCYITINSANNIEPADSSNLIGRALIDSFEAALRMPDR